MNNESTPPVNNQLHDLDTGEPPLRSRIPGGDRKALQSRAQPAGITAATRLLTALRGSFDNGGGQETR
jgi:hypothetical protein